MKTLGKNGFKKKHGVFLHVWCKRFKDRNWNVEDQRKIDQILGTEGQERFVAIKKTLNESKTLNIKSLPAKTGGCM